jgi:hypothetical protein
MYYTLFGNKNIILHYKERIFICRTHYYLYDSIENNLFIIVYN